MIMTRNYGLLEIVGEEDVPDYIEVEKCAFDLTTKDFKKLNTLKINIKVKNDQN